MRNKLPVTADSMRDWLARPEWRYLVLFLQEQERETMEALLGARPEDAASIARAQGEVRCLRYVTQGELAEALKNELKDRSAGL